MAAIADRPELQAVGVGDLDQRVAAAAALSAEINARISGVWRALVEAAAADPEVDGWRAELEANRRRDTALGLERVAGAPVSSTSLDAVWVLLGPESYLTLTRGGGMTREAYERFLVEAVRRLLD